MNQPKLSVIMPVYNSENFLTEAIDSILNQSFTDFEFIIINDGSTDKSRKIISEYVLKDNRIRFIDLDDNHGLIYVLNLGLDKAQGRYIARMDADDISAPSRFQNQIKFLENNPDVILTFSSTQHIDKLGREIGNKSVYVPSAEIKMKLFFNCVIAHPSVCFRTEIVQDHNLKYDENFLHAEDYDLWTRMSNFGDFFMMPEVLLYYRVHDNQISKTKQSIQKTNSNKIRKKYLLNNLPFLNELEIEEFIKMANYDNNCDIHALINIRNSLSTKISETEIMKRESLLKVFNERLFLILLRTGIRTKTNRSEIIKLLIHNPSYLKSKVNIYMLGKWMLGKKSIEN